MAAFLCEWQLFSAHMQGFYIEKQRGNSRREKREQGTCCMIAQVETQVYEIMLGVIIHSPYLLFYDNFVFETNVSVHMTCMRSLPLNFTTVRNSCTVHSDI